MADDTSKNLCGFLRDYYPGLKASHARELVASLSLAIRAMRRVLADKRNGVD